MSQYYPLNKYKESKDTIINLISFQLVLFLLSCVYTKAGVKFLTPKLCILTLCVILTYIYSRFDRDADLLNYNMKHFILYVHSAFCFGNSY